MTRAVVIACVLLGALAADAAASHQLIFDVPAEGGIFEIPVHPKRLTVLYFPAAVTSFVNGKAEGARVTRQQHIMSVEIAPATPQFTMSVDCALFRVGLLLRPVADPDDAAIQVQFRDLSRHELIQAEVEKRMKQRRAELDIERARIDAERLDIERTRARLDRVIQERARERVAAGLGKRLEIVRVKATTRNRDQVVARIREIVWLGEDAYIRLSLQNRGGKVFRVADASVVVEEIIEPVRLVTPGTGTELARVRAHGVGYGIVIIPGAAALGRATVALVLNRGMPEELALRVVLQK